MMINKNVILFILNCACFTFALISILAFVFFFPRADQWKSPDPGEVIGV